MKISLLSLSLSLTALPVFGVFDYLTSVNPGAGSSEILAYTPDDFTLLSTLSTGSTHGVKILDFSNPLSVSTRAFADFSSTFSGNIDSVTSTASTPWRAALASPPSSRPTSTSPPARSASLTTTPAPSSARSMSAMLPTPSPSLATAPKSTS